MIFEKTGIADVWRVLPEPQVDRRGSFARVFCRDEFASHGLVSAFEQTSLSRNAQRGTLRGMHFQEHPHAEVKFVRCVRGSLMDVVIDLRRGSPTYRRWVSETLTAANSIGLYVGAGLAHGFQTMEDDTDVLYQITPAHQGGLGRGVRWNDPAFDVTWPIPNAILSERDAQYPDYPK